MKYNIAFGEDICQTLYEGDLEKVVEIINNDGGDIVGFDTEQDYIGELLEHAMGNNYYAMVSEVEMAEINNLLEGEF